GDFAEKGWLHPVASGEEERRGRTASTIRRPFFEGGGKRAESAFLLVAGGSPGQPDSRHVSVRQETNEAVDASHACRLRRPAGRFRSQRLRNRCRYRIPARGATFRRRRLRNLSTFP